MEGARAVGVVVSGAAAHRRERRARAAAREVEKAVGNCLGSCLIAVVMRRTGLV